MRLIEPLGLLSGAAVAVAIGRGVALPLGGDAFAYAVARLIDDGGDVVVPIGNLPAEWREAARVLARPAPPWAGLSGKLVVMGIVNVTPDSFSDGGDYFDSGRATDAAAAMVAAGAGILDIGGESTRPGAAPVAPAEEVARVVPVIRRIRDLGVPISIDTRNAAVMAAALDAGASIVNDVSALAHDSGAANLVASRGAFVVLTHMRGTPATMTTLATYEDVAVEVTRELAARIAAAEAAGIAREKIVVDPGIGFAKHQAHSLEILRRLPVLMNLGCRILVGASRKSFVSRISGATAPKAALAGSLAAALFALSRGASILRAHDVAEMVQAVRMWRAMTEK